VVKPNEDRQPCHLERRLSDSDAKSKDLVFSQLLLKPMPFTKIAAQSELPPADEAQEFPCGDKTICIANVNGVFTAMDNVCLHRGGPLGQGMIEGGKVVCPWHGWAWDVRTGAAEQDGSMKVAIYPLKIENGDVLIEI
jgi:nitrite reductase (NADH) small subunit